MTWSCWIHSTCLLFKNMRGIPKYDCISRRLQSGLGLMLLQKGKWLLVCRNLPVVTPTPRLHRSSSSWDAACGISISLPRIKKGTPSRYSWNSWAFKLSLASINFSMPNQNASTKYITPSTCSSAMSSSDIYCVTLKTWRHDSPQQSTTNPGHQTHFWLG